MKFLCEQCKAKYQIADEKAAGKTVRMKCRKCGHLIEVRAVATEAGTSSPPPADGAAGARPPTTTTARLPQRPAPPRGASPATSLEDARPHGLPGHPHGSLVPARAPAKAGPLASALKSALQSEDELSAPVDMSGLSANDEWYVAINGVPVGPIRIAEVRRKVAVGAVTHESLCWQEGLDEWRPLRSFPELAGLLRDAFASTRPSAPPPPPPPPKRPSVRPPAPAVHASGPSGTAPRAPPAWSPVVASAPPRSNVVPFTSRLATAEKLAEAPDDRARPFIEPEVALPPPFQPSVVPDPFAAPPRPALAAKAIALGDAAATAHTPSPSVPPGSLAYGASAKRSPPWMAIAMVVAAMAFGVTAAVVLFVRPPPAPTPVAQSPGAPPAVALPASPPASTSSLEPEPGATSTPTGIIRAPAVIAALPKATASAPSAAPASHGPLDLHGLTGATVAPTEDPGSAGEGPKAPGQCLSESQVQQVIAVHSVGLRRACWERSLTQKPSANVTVSLTIGSDGSAQGVSASGDEPSVASCIANDVRNWRFAAMGCSQRTAIPFHFVRQ